MVTINETQSRILQSGDSLRTSAIANEGDKLQKADFMNLFMYQLSNQNPLDPMDSAKMMSSLSQLGSMEQLQALNTKIAELATAQRELVQFSALNFINRRVQIQDNNFTFNVGDNPNFGYKLPVGALNVKANILNSENQVVQQIDLGAGQQGLNQLSWDGKTSQGEYAKAGNYKVEVHAYDEQGKQVAAEITKEEKVSHIKIDNGQPLLKVGDRYIHISEALLID